MINERFENAFDSVGRPVSLVGLIGFLELFFYIIPVFLMMGAGGFARARGWLNDAAEQGLLKVVVNLLYPAFLFTVVSTNESIRLPGIIVTAVLTGFLFVLAGYGLFYLTAPLFGLRQSSEKRSFSFTGGVYNYGYFAYPVVVPLFGAEALGVMMVISMGVELALWSVGILLVNGELSRASLRRMASPPLMALVVAITFNLLGLPPYIPQFLFAGLELIGSSAVPMGLMMIGATTWKLMREAPLFTRPLVAVGSCLLRLGALPLILIAVYAVLPAPLALKQAALVHATMPCGILPIVLTRIYGGRVDIALRTVIPTCLLCLFTIPLWIQFGMRWYGW